MESGKVIAAQADPKAHESKDGCPFYKFPDPEQNESGIYNLKKNSYNIGRADRCLE